MMDSVDETAREQSAGETQERSRADLYGLLARLWMRAPDRELLHSLQGVTIDPAQPGGQLAAPWHALVTAMCATSLDAAAEEYDALFQGVGRPEVFLFGSYYLAGSLNQRPLAHLRGDLRELGLTRDTARAETEDHVAFLFEVMQYLIAGDDTVMCCLERQRRFFRTHLQPWIEPLCDAVVAHPRAAVWRAVAELTRSFMQVEAQGFDLLDV